MKKILIIGAGFLQSHVIKRAKELKYYVYAVDADLNAIGFSFADEYAVINIVDQEACLAYAKEKEIDGVLTAATDYGVLTASYIARELGLPGIDYEVAKLVKNKFRVRKCLFEHHVDDSDQAYEVTDCTNIQELAQQIRFPVMVKPCDGSGSRGASRVDSIECLENACKIAMKASISHRAEVENFIIGHEYGAESFVENGNVHIMGIMKKWMTEPPYYAELGHAIPCGLPEEIEAHARECVKKAIKALGIDFGSVNMDMLITEEGKVYVIDIGARMGGNMIGPWIIPQGTGIDYIGNMLAATVGETTEWTSAFRHNVSTRLIASNKEGIIIKEPDISSICREYQVTVAHHIKLKDTVNKYRTNLDGLGYIMAINESVDKASLLAEAAKHRILETILGQ